MELLDKTIEDIFDKNNHAFPIKTTCIIAIQLVSLKNNLYNLQLNRLEYIHNKFYIHRDIKPENFMSGRKEYKDVLYLIDFGLSKRYIDPKTGQHIKYTNNKRLNGTARYASIHALEGYELSRRDDLEGLCYVLIYFLNGTLPWGRIKIKNKQEKYKIILNMKKRTTADILVGDKNNVEFIEFVKYCRKLKFEEKPDYDYLRGLMTTCISKNNKTIDHIYNNYINNAKNPLFFSQERNSNINVGNHVKRINNKNYKNNRANTTKKYKINLYALFTQQRKVENEEFDNKIINESKSSSLGYIEKKVRTYSSFKKHGIKDIQNSVNVIKKESDNNIINMKTISKNTTNFRSPNEVNPTINKRKSYRRSRYNFIKRNLGFEDNEDEVLKNDTNGKFIINNNNINGLNEDINNNNLKDDGCIIL